MILRFVSKLGHVVKLPIVPQGGRNFVTTTPSELIVRLEACGTVYLVGGHADCSFVKEYVENANGNWTWKPIGVDWTVKDKPNLFEVEERPRLGFFGRIQR